jgi:HD-GYP domain-containing protein (c-di-GMP phosphodiesterase class II)
MEPSPLESPSPIESKQPSPAATTEVLKLGNQLVTKFHVLMRVSQIYDAKNVALQQFLQEFLQTINALVKREDWFSLKIIKDEFYLKDQRLRYSVEGFASFKYLLTHWKKRLIGEVIIRAPVDEKTLTEFISILVSLEEGRQENAAFFTRQLANRGITSIEVLPLKISEEDSSLHREEDQKKVGKKVFFEMIGTVKEVGAQIVGSQQIDVRRLKRLVQKSVELAMEDESILLGLTTIKNYDEYTYNHSVNVSIYALAMGRRLGLSRRALTELGMTGLFHDLGKSKIPKEVLNKPGALADDEWRIMKEHPMTGVKIILNLKQLGDINPRMAIGVFDHHLKADLSGYPKLFRKQKASLFGRILQIVDAYDAMTTPRIYKKNPLTPSGALALMLKEKGFQFDPILLKVMIGIIGMYPIGSLVFLNTKEMGIVTKSNPDPRWADRPQVILIASEKGGGVAVKGTVDLTETNGGGHFKRSVVKALDPNRYHIDVAKYFL